MNPTRYDLNMSRMVLRPYLNKGFSQQEKKVTRQAEEEQEKTHLFLKEDTMSHIPKKIFNFTILKYGGC